MTDIDCDLCFYETARDACRAFGALLDRIDRRGTVDDSVILSRYGKAIYEAYLEAERAYRDLECYFDDD